MKKTPRTDLTSKLNFFRKSLSTVDPDHILFYDIETDNQYAPYAKLKSIGVQYGFDGKREIVDRRSRRIEFRQKLRAPDVLKVDFNGVNFDTIVLGRHGYKLNRTNHHDVFLMFKTLKQNLPAFGLKFLSFYYLRDPHFPELEISNWCAKHGKKLAEAPAPLLRRYNLHDTVQTCNLFRIAWDHIIKNEYWDPYLLSLFIGEPLEEMETEGGIFLDVDRVWRKLQSLQRYIKVQTDKAIKITHGRVQNPNSSKQLGDYFTEFDKLELELTANDQFCVKKSVLVELRESNPLADCAYNIRQANGSLKYFENYLNALEDETYSKIHAYGWIPTQYSGSAARTRRFTSQSLYKLNFQNPNEDAKEVQIVPAGQLGWWYDATQVENIVHIYESKDDARRAAYEADPDWNEYVWLCNEILGTHKTKDELDDKENSRSIQIPHWTQYKQYKTGKLGINFGMGTVKFCKLFGLDLDVGREIFEHIHGACPAIRELQRRVGHDLSIRGYVADAFGKRYSGPVSEAYKVVAYLIQGCGTGSLPQAQIRANWESLRRFDSRMPRLLKSRKCGVMCTTTHDENGGRIDLRLGDENILMLLQRLQKNMTSKFSPLFDDIPLRAKLYLSKTTAKNAIECKITDTDKIMTIINGEACPTCLGTGHKDKKICNECKSWGYIL